MFVSRLKKHFCSCCNMDGYELDHTSVSLFMGCSLTRNRLRNKTPRFIHRTCSKFRWFSLSTQLRPSQIQLLNSCDIWGIEQLSYLLLVGGAGLRIAEGLEVHRETHKVYEEQNWESVGVIAPVHSKYFIETSAKQHLQKCDYLQARRFLMLL